MPLSLRHLVLAALLPSAAYSLICYVCATGQLGEFGECQEQFQYDCTPYASKFPGERTYCRTTREKHSNGTFSVMKECISETDHYSRFPEKGYPLDEECDLVDIHGAEVAYCVCHSKDCNQNPIADQFMAFEEKHPELFGDVDENAFQEKPGRPTLPQGKAPLSFAAPQAVPPAIVPINDRRFGSPPGSDSSTEIRRQPSQASRQQLPSREVPPVNTGILAFSGISPVRQSGFVGTVGRDPVSPISPRAPVKPPTVARPVAELPPPIIPHFAPPAPPKQPSLRCVQCGERGLIDLTSDCSKQTVLECSQPEEICFTRMIVLAPGQHAVEKMCVAPESVRAMFGDGAVNGECGTASQGKEHYCTCTTNECNRLPLHDQRGLRSPATSAPQPVSTSVPALPLPESPAPPQPVFDLPSPPNEPEVMTAAVFPKTAPSPPQSPKHEEKLLPIVPVVSQPRKKADLRCSFCQEDGITDPTADCQATATRDCRDGQTMCMTQQTQMDSDFRMEKKCVSLEEFANIVDGEPFEEGCATADEGMVNYCLCRGDKCNAVSLLGQAQTSGVREAFEQARHETGLPKTNSVEDVEDQPRTPARQQPVLPVVVNGAPTHVERVPSKDAEDEELELRRQKWAEADLNGNGALRLSPLLLPLAIILL